MNINTKKYYDYESFGGGMPEEVRKAWDDNVTCTCADVYKSRGMAAPDCAHCNYDHIPEIIYSLATEKLKEQEQEIERLKAENERLRGEGWISVEDRLPEDDEDYQVWEHGAIIATAAHYRTKKYFLEHYENEDYMEEGWYYSFKYPFDEKLDTDNPIEVTHWMPLIPPPPKSK